METEKQTIKTYSRRQPIAKYESRAMFVPSCVNLTHVRESRLNDKTLIVENFDDTFDRLAAGVVITSSENSSNENEIAKKDDSDMFDIFKVPLQAKKKENPKKEGKPKKKDQFSKVVGVKRKKINSGSDGSSSSDPEENHKKQNVIHDVKKSKENIKRAVKEKQSLSPVKVVTNDDELIASENANDNVPKKSESNNKENTKNDNNVKKTKALSAINQHKISQYFLASTPRIDRIQSKIDTQNLSPVVMEKNVEKEKETLLHSSVQEIQIENVGDEQNTENINKILEHNESNDTNATGNFAKPKDFTKIQLLKTSSNLFTSTPRINKIRLPVNFQNLSLITSDKDKITSLDTNEKFSIIDIDAKNNENHEIESNILALREQIAEPTKLDKIHHNGAEDNEDPLHQEKTNTSQLNQQELRISSMTNKDNNKDNRISGRASSESASDVQDDSLIPADGNKSDTKPQLNETPLVNITQSFVNSPLLFDDSDYIQNKTGKNIEIEKITLTQINFSQNFSKNIEENSKESANLETGSSNNRTHPKPPITKDKKFDVSTESSFYPDDWTNDYDTTYGYDQQKTNLEKDAIHDSMINENENKNLTSNTNRTNIKNNTEINDVLNIDNTEIQPVENHGQDKSKYPICDEDNVIECSKDQSDEQKHLNATSICSGSDHGSKIIEKDNFQESQSIIEEKQSYHKDKDASIVDEPDDSITKDSENLNDQYLALSARPSKRRKTDASEIMIFDKVEDDHTNMQNGKECLDESSKDNEERISVPENTNSEDVNTEFADISLTRPIQCKEKIKKLPGKELRIILSRVNDEEYKSPILSDGRSVKRKSVKRLSKKSKQENTTEPHAGRITKKSITEMKMRQLFKRYQCKELTILTARLEEQRLDLPSKSLKRKSRDNSIAENTEPDSSLSNGGLSEFLLKLNDPVKMATWRKTYKKYDGQLAAITEDQTGQKRENKISKKVVTWGNEKRVTFNDFRQHSEDNTEDNDRKSQPIFLKPGKSWARSLSIINHFHNGKNLDELAAGRENWRHSVQTLLNMQPEVSVRSSSQNQEETQRESRASSQRESRSMRKSSTATNSRFSMRIIPSGKRSTLTDDLIDSHRTSHVSDRSRSSRKTSLKIRRDTLIETEDDLIRTAKDIILKRCKQTCYEPFDVCFPDSYINNCRKIGEGVYGEVFLYENDSVKSVIKVIPIEGDQLVNCEPQKKFHEILSEIIIAEELHKLRYGGEFNTNGFVEVNRIMCVIGKYPQKLIDLWYAYDEQKKSENDCPSMFEKDQLYIILELAHGGQDLEAYTFQNASESYAIFLQTALTLAVAEQSLHFEHRDLHWGNLLISKTEDKHSTYKLNSKKISLPTKGVKVAVIDFTLSRMSYQGCNIFNDLAADPTLFEAQGEYQFDIYRMMRDNIDNDWQRFNPFTNVLWMDYTLDKMITAVRYKKKTTKIHKSAIENMKTLRKEIMNYSSAFDFVTNCKNFKTIFGST